MKWSYLIHELEKGNIRIMKSVNCSGRQPAIHSPLDETQQMMSRIQVMGQNRHLGHMAGEMGHCSARILGTQKC